MNKKGQLGMDISQGFVLGIVILIIISFIGVIIFGNLDDVSSTTVPQTQSLSNGTITNESIVLGQTAGLVNRTSVAIPLTNLTGLSIRNLVVINGTSAGDPELTAANFTFGLTTGNVTLTATSEFLGGQQINFSFDYTYQIDSIAKTAQNNILANSTAGVATFWSNATTWFSLLSIVILILIVAIVLVVVNRFSGNKSGI